MWQPYFLFLAFQQPWTWDGELPEAACNILHQHVIQGDLTDLQVASLRWRALSRKAKTVQINFRVLYDALRNLEERWEKEVLTPQEVRIIYPYNVFLSIISGKIKKKCRISSFGFSNGKQ